MSDLFAGGIAVPRILIPDEKVNMKKWSVVACDQFVYDRAYWGDVEHLVGNAPSTLHMMLPEAYLGEQSVASRIEDAKDAMFDYIEAGVLKELPEGFILVERSIKGRSRIGLMVMLDLEQYEFEPGMRPVIRPTEQTIKNRIPPRMQIRIGAAVEMPHILALIDDPERTVIEPVYEMKSKLKKLYDFELMKDGGRIAGYFADDPACIKGVLSAMAALDSHDGMKIAVGDGNHSLATAKEVWNRSKQSMSERERKISPLRYALCELVNLNDPALEIEPIHRAVVGMNPSSCIQFIVDKLNQKRRGAKLIFSRKKRFPGWGEPASESSRTIYFSSKDSNGRIELASISGVLALEDLQPVLEQLADEMPNVHIEYIHGNDKIAQMANNYDTLCFTLPSIRKEDFMDTIVRCGVLPKKCFSLGEENEKRYYLESRLLIIPDDDGEPERREEEQAAAQAPEPAAEEFAEELMPPAYDALPSDGILDGFDDLDGEPEPAAVTERYRDDLDDLIDGGAPDEQSDLSSIIED